MKATIITGTEEEIAALVKELNRAANSTDLVMIRKPPRTGDGVHRKFIPLTKSKKQTKQFAKLLDEKGLTKEDLTLILSTISLNLETFQSKEDVIL